MRNDPYPPYLPMEADYWRCPVHVFTGLSWFLLGGLVGVAIGVLVY